MIWKKKKKFRRGRRRKKNVNTTASQVKDWTLGAAPGVAARPKTYHERWGCDSLEQQIWHLQWATSRQREQGKKWEQEGNLRNSQMKQPPVHIQHTRFAGRAGEQTDGTQSPAQGQRARVWSNTQTNAKTTQGTGLYTTGAHAAFHQLEHHKTTRLSKLVDTKFTQTKQKFPESFHRRKRVG